MRLLAVILLACSASHAALLGSNKCTYGPSYWCRGLRQSAECGATSHCADKYWSRLRLKEDDDDICTICKNMVQEARDQLNSNETLSELQQVFEGSCRLIPIKVVADECCKLSDEFIVELVDTLSSEMNPQVVCAVAGLCNSERVDKLLAARAAAGGVDTECQVCKRESQKLADKIESMDVGAVQDKLLEICGNVGGSYADACKATVIENFQIIYGMLSNLGDGQLCDFVGICSESNVGKPADYVTDASTSIGHSGGASLECQFCEKVIKHWVDVWTSNTTEEEFKEILDGLCHKMMNEERVKRCLHIVDDYYIPWFDFLAHEINPQEACTVVGICGESAPGFMELDPKSSVSVLLPTYSREDEIKIKPLQPAIRLTGREESRHEEEAMGPIDPSQGLIGGYFVPQTVVQMSKPSCFECSVATWHLDKAIKAGKDADTAVHHVCYQFPDQTRDSCSSMMGKFGLAMHMLMTRGGLPRGDVCPVLEICPMTPDADPMEEQSALPTAELQLQRRNDDSCTMCKMVFDEVYAMLNDSADQRMVKNALDTVCLHLPDSVSNECEKLVAEFTAPAIELLINMVDPDRICSALRMCKAKPNKDDQKCVFCEFVIQTLDQEITQNATREEIKQGLDKLCSYLPKNLGKECDTFVNDYTDQIIDLIANGMSPQQVCDSLGLCNDAASPDWTVAVRRAVFESEREREAVRGMVVRGEESEDDRPYCTLCEYAIGEVDQMLEDKHNEEEIKQALDKICYMLTAPIKKECVNMVEKYTDQIIDLFVKEYTPRQICEELKLCKPDTRAQLHSNDIPPLGNDLAVVVMDPEPTETVKNGFPCVMCEFAVTFVENKLLTNRTVDMAERAVQMFCAYLPESLAEKCEKFVDDYGDEIIKLIMEEEFGPEAVCTSLHLCLFKEGDNVYDATPLGGRPCRWGPSYWCQSRFHAKQCGTTRHCERFVWGN